MTDLDLVYAAESRCSCGAGMAYPPLTLGASEMATAWTCSRVLRGEVSSDGHTVLPFAFWKVREETSINNGGKYTTRPPGTVIRTVGKAECDCGHTWESEPYEAPGLRHHWFPGPCGQCGNTNGSAGITEPGPRIKVRFRDVTSKAE